MPQYIPRLRFCPGLPRQGIPAKWICFDADDRLENLIKSKPMPQGYDIQEAFRNWKKRRRRREITRRLFSALNWKRDTT